MLAKAFYVGQVIMSVLVILFGVAFGIRSLANGQIFCAICFGVMAYVSGYKLMLRASWSESREYNAKENGK